MTIGSAHHLDYYQVVHDNVSIGVQIVELLYDHRGVPVDYQYLDVNSTYAKLLGSNKEEMVGKKATDYLSDIEPEWFVKYGEIVSRGTPERFEMYNQSLGRWFDVLTIPLGEGSRFAILYTDITDRRDAEKRLQETQQIHVYLLKLSDILRSLSDEPAIRDAATRLLKEHLKVPQASYSDYHPDVRHEHFVSMYGTYLGTNFPNAMDKLSSGRDVVLADILTLDEISKAEREYLLSLDIRATISTPIFRNGDLVAALSAHSEVPRTWSADEVELVWETAERTWVAIERARFAKAVEESEAKYRTLFETSNDGFWWADHNGYVLEANEGAAKMLGYAQGELEGKFWEEVVDEEWLTKGYKQWENRKALQTGRYTIKLKKKDGSPVWARVSGSPIVFGDNQYAGTLASFKDITEQKKIEDGLVTSERRALALVAALEAADQRKNESISILSHELRNPLATISAGIELLELTGQSDPSLQTVAIVKRQIRSLARLVDDLLDLTRITHHKLGLQRKRVELNSVIACAIEDVEPQFEKKGVGLTKNLAKAPIWVNADAYRITQCITNLLQNALQYTLEQGTAHISLGAEGEKAVIRVEDTGMGISPEALQDVFLPFKQEAGISRAYHNRGLGLGLAIVKGIVLAHGGEVTASSPGLGKGALFTLSLPIERSDH